jgi:hypothetical protein
VSGTARPGDAPDAVASGAGERDVAVPFEQLKFVNEPRAIAAAPMTTTVPAANPNAPATTGATTAAPTAQTTAAARMAPDHTVLMVIMTKDQLKSAPEFKYTR